MKNHMLTEEHRKYSFPFNRETMVVITANAREIRGTPLTLAGQPQYGGR